MDAAIRDLEEKVAGDPDDVRQLETMLGLPATDDHRVSKLLRQVQVPGQRFTVVPDHAM